MNGQNQQRQQAASPAAQPQATEQPDSDFLRLVAGRKVSYIPQGETSPIEMSCELVNQYLVRPTKSGVMPDKAAVTKFVMLCKARELNPWVGDAYLVGYDGKDGPEFSLITSVHALHKRADRCQEYDGLAAGVVVKTAEGVQEITGTCYPDGAVLLGGWARVKRKDRSDPYYVSLRLQGFDKGRSLWNTDKAGMIRKCAIAAALREAFPNQTSGLYTGDELPAMVAAATAQLTADTTATNRPNAKQLAQLLATKRDEPNLTGPQHEPAAENGHPGDAEAADAAQHIAEQTLPPTLTADEDLDVGAEVEIGEAGTMEDVDRVFAAWLPKCTSDHQRTQLKELATKRLAELTANKTATGKRANKQRTLPGEA